MAGKTGGAASVPLIDPPRDTEEAKTAPVSARTTFPGPNLTPRRPGAAVTARLRPRRSHPTAGCGKSSTAPEAATS